MTTPAYEVLISVISHTQDTGILYTLTLAFVVVLLLRLYLNNVRVYPKNFPPGPRLPLPIFGDALAIGRELPPGLERLHKKYGNIIGFKLGKHFAVSISDYENMSELMFMKEFSGRPPTGGLEMYRRDGEVTKEGTGLIFSHGERFQSYQRFCIKNLNELYDTCSNLEEHIQMEAEDMVTRLEQKGTESFSIAEEFYFPGVSTLFDLIKGERVDATDPHLQELARTMFEQIKNYGHPLVQIASNNVKLMKTLERWGFHNMGLLFRQFDEFIKPVIEKHKATLDKSKPRDFIDRFLIKKHDESTPKAKRESDIWLRAILFDFFAGGSDTTSNTLSWTMLYMANHQDVQAKVQEELDRVCGTRYPGQADRGSLPYVEATLAEMQRLGDVMPIANYHYTTENVKWKCYFIPKGTLVIPMLSMMHKHPRNFANPHDFNPDRFIRRGKFVSHPQFCPYGLGIRRCIGEPLAKMSLFLFFIRILKKFRIKPPPGVTKLSEKRLYGFTVIPEPYKIVLEKR